jgi:hypothetical protein
VIAVPDPGDELTVTEAIATLRGRGFEHDFSVAPSGLIRCSACGHDHQARDFVVEATLRIEGASDPDDEAAVFGAQCARCGIRGVLVVAYGPAASSEEANVLVALGDALRDDAGAAMIYSQLCPRCGQEVAGSDARRVADAVVAHARDVHNHALDRAVAMAHLQGRHPFDDEP